MNTITLTDATTEDKTPILSFQSSDIPQPGDLIELTTIDTPNRQEITKAYRVGFNTRRWSVRQDGTGTSHLTQVSVSVMEERTR